MRERKDKDEGGLDSAYAVLAIQTLRDLFLKPTKEVRYDRVVSRVISLSAFLRKIHVVPQHFR